jgi:O-antigen ligase
MFFTNNFFNYIRKFLILFFPFSLLFGPAILNLYVLLLIISSLLIYKFEPFLKYKYFVVSSVILAFYLIFVASFKFIDLDSFIKSFLFLRFPLLAILTSFLFYKHKVLEKYFEVLMLIFIFLFCDSLIQFFFQKNIFLQQPLTTGGVYRITSVFGKESILGSYILKLTYPVLVIYSLKFKQSNFLLLFIFVLSLFLIIISGERIILLKFLLFNFILLLFLKKYQYLFITVMLTLLMIVSFFYSSEYFSNRIVSFYEAVFNFVNTPYFPLFEKAMLIFKDNIFFGVGFKNFRHVCNYDEYSLILSYLINAGCSTHPHNYIMEILSETGIIGFFLFFNLFLYVIFKSIYNHNRIDYLVFFALFLSLLWPIGTNSSFYSSFNGYIIWFNIGIMLSYTTSNENFNSN